MTQNWPRKQRPQGSSLERAFEKKHQRRIYNTRFQNKATRTRPGPSSRWLGSGRREFLCHCVGRKGARAEGYSIGTDDRAIREYITTQSRELRRQALRNIYYIVISSHFNDGGDEMIRSLKMDTDISEVILLDADALVAIVDMKLRDPHEVTLGSDGLQRLFTSSGILNAEKVRELLG